MRIYQVPLVKHKSQENISPGPNSELSSGGDILEAFPVSLRALSVSLFRLSKKSDSAAGDLDVTADIKPKAERVSLNTSERGEEWGKEEEEEEAYCKIPPLRCKIPGRQKPQSAGSNSTDGVDRWHETWPPTFAVNYFGCDLCRG